MHITFSRLAFRLVIGTFMLAINGLLFTVEVQAQTPPSIQFTNNPNFSAAASNISLLANENGYAVVEMNGAQNILGCYENESITEGVNRQGWCDFEGNWLAMNALAGNWQQDGNRFLGTFSPIGNVLPAGSYNFFVKSAQDGAIGVQANVTVIADGTTGDAACSLIDHETPIPNGFGSAFNMLRNPRELLIRIECQLSAALVHVGNNLENLYIFDVGYVWRGHQWEAFQFDCNSEKIDRSWCVGSATAQVSNLNLTTEAYVIAYTCQWANKEWNCGCRDKACTENLWQLQSFLSTNPELYPEPEAAVGGDTVESEGLKAIPTADCNAADATTIATPGDWGKINNPQFRVFCVQPGNYSAAGIIRITSSGTAAAPRMIVPVNGATEVMPWKLPEAQRVIIGGIDMKGANNWVVSGIVGTDPGRRFTGRVIRVGGKSQNVIYNRVLLEKNDGTLFNITEGAQNVVLQSCEIHF